MTLFHPVPALLVCAALAACSGGARKADPAQTAPSPNARTIGMANPASAYCAELGGQLQIRTEDAGQAGYCHLPDGSVIEEWQLYRGKNAL